LIAPIAVDTPAMWPHACVQCRSATGPLVDTHVHDANENRVYVCASCVRLDAIALGLLEGDRNATLLHAAEGESAAQKQLEAMTARRDKLAAKAKDLEKDNAALTEHRDWLAQRVAQLEAAITDDARSRLAVVGNEAA
jgi:cell division protein FtsB